LLIAGLTVTVITQDEVAASAAAAAASPAAATEQNLSSTDIYSVCTRVCGIDVCPLYRPLAIPRRPRSAVN